MSAVTQPRRHDNVWLSDLLARSKANAEKPFPAYDGPRPVAKPLDEFEALLHPGRQPTLGEPLGNPPLDKGTDVPPAPQGQTEQPRHYALDLEDLERQLTEVVPSTPATTEAPVKLEATLETVTVSREAPNAAAIAETAALVAEIAEGSESPAAPKVSPLPPDAITWQQVATAAAPVNMPDTAAGWISKVAKPTPESPSEKKDDSGYGGDDGNGDDTDTKTRPNWWIIGGIVGVGLLVVAFVWAMNSAGSYTARKPAAVATATVPAAPVAQAQAQAEAKAAEAKIEQAVPAVPALPPLDPKLEASGPSVPVGFQPPVRANNATATPRFRPARPVAAAAAQPARPAGAETAKAVQAPAQSAAPRITPPRPVAGESRQDQLMRVFACNEMPQGSAARGACMDRVVKILDTEYAARQNPQDRPQGAAARPSIARQTTQPLETCGWGKTCFMQTTN